MSNNHSWFNKAVTRWLDIALYKAMERITRAVELDELSPVDEYVEHSSSAVDIKTVLVQIKTFWQQLNWPDVEASYAFISKILDVSFLYFIFFFVNRIGIGIYFFVFFTNYLLFLCFEFLNQAFPMCW